MDKIVLPLLPPGQDPICTLLLTTCSPLYYKQHCTAWDICLDRQIIDEYHLKKQKQNETATQL
jgi:hypothetical protein